ncbi:MAG TPA: hypothetical protein VFT75_18745 [Nocardioidaceae bacterium]|jgi:hypothetical protein|nr:hypothetical protein [Nocardioidaceae bacterium]
MAAEIFIETEHGICTGWRHPHNGYYAGDFSERPTRQRTQPLATLNRQ